MSITNFEAGSAAGHVRARWVRGLLIAGIVLDVIAILSGFAQQSLLARAAAGGGVTETEVAANDARHGTIGLFQLFFFIATGIAWLTWLHRAYSNLSLAGTGKSDHTPGWAVGWWFVPFMNLVRPYQIVRELWLRSAKDNGLETVKGLAAPVIVIWWWGIHLVSAVLSRVSMSVAFHAKSIGELQTVTHMGLFVDGLAVVSAMLSLAVVANIDALQRVMGRTAAPEASPAPTAP